MKFRNGFVTNSSSSSFIIGKRELDKFTIDDIFNLIKDMYNDWINISNKVFDYVNQMHKDNPKYPWIENYHICFEKEMPFNKKCDIKEHIEKIFSISMFDLFDGEKKLDFLECKNYEEYREWGLNAINKAYSENKNTYGIVPFDIAYMTNPKPELLHNGILESKSSTLPVWCEVIQWYKEDCFDVYDDSKDSKNSICNECDEYQYCNGEYHNSMKIATQLGEICIYSECGFIPDYVVKQLADISNFYCNHMG